MKFRTLPETEIRVSEIGFGLWTLSTGWWGKFTEGEAVALMHRALDLGVTLYDAADTYGNGLSEELIAKAFPNQRDQIVIATKVGYNFYEHGNERRGQREIPHDFSVPFIRDAVDKALARLNTDRIDILQLHNIRMAQVDDDALWELMENLMREGKIRSYGAALGPAIGWLYEGVDCVQRRRPHILQHIYNALEPHPGRQIMDEGEALTDPARPARTRYLIRVTHSSGMLEGKYTSDTVFPPTDHRSHRPKSWLVNGLKKIETLQFLVGPGRTLGQAALQWLLADPRIACCLPNIYEEAQLREFAAASESPALTRDELARVAQLAAGNFGILDETPNYKGTMTRETAAA
ncbi:MAG TPA: aldo/keto reductase [Candidatus Methylacidiphilales bacterium]|jgi:aryl-alcohol dehydrogenase-like predicted oxidoreductase|nr:aldo/keto reductase [Candidatus Methylacidiphilales bacterium]